MSSVRFFLDIVKKTADRGDESAFPGGRIGIVGAENSEKAAASGDGRCASVRNARFKFLPIPNGIGILQSHLVGLEEGHGSGIRLHKYYRRARDAPCLTDN